MRIRLPCLAAIAAVALSSIGAATAASGPAPANENFYEHVNAAWIAEHAIPKDRASYGSFDVLEQLNEERIRQIVAAPALEADPPGSEGRKIGDLYAACENTAQIDRAGIAALQPQFDAIAKLRSATDLARIAGTGDALASGGHPPLFAFGSEQDPKAATHVIAGLGQGGLTLPTPEYYSATDAKSVAIRDAYAKELRAMFALLGDDAPAATAEAAGVIAIETALAHGSKSPDQLRDPVANYHPMTAAALASLAPHLDFTTYFATVGLPGDAREKIDVGQPDFVKALDAAVATQPIPAWQSYLRWHALSAGGQELPSGYRDALFAFRSVLYGIPSQPTRERTCGLLVGGDLGFAVGKIYTARYFSPAAKARAASEIATIVGSLRQSIETVGWMGPQTRALALAKLAKLSTVKVGYPDKPMSYEKLAISPTDALGDVIASNRFEFARDVAKIGKPLDRTQWGLTPQTINAYYDPSMNEIVIPAGILQAPFFDEHATDAANFGGIGAVIGHELTHGYDDEGSDFDGNGNLNKIVTPEDEAKFHARVACIVKQADDYVASDGLHLNGKLDAGEATADVGGTTLAYNALGHAVGRDLESPAATPSPDAAVGAATPAQQFYMSWAKVWRANVRPQAERAQILGDPHPVSSYRVNATVSDEAPFYTAFGVKPGDAMYRPEAERCSVW